jgi:hypothetical protein
MQKLWLSGILMTAVALAAPPAATTVTFNKDVLPILQQHCQSCHRPGEVAPMTLMDYQSTRPWAKAIKAAVASKKMPPWTADQRYGHFRNDVSLTQAEIDTLASWADNGSPEGNAKDKPAPVQWTEGWMIKPDHIVSLTEPFPVPAKGVVELTNFVVPTGFTKDTWITSIEFKPGNRSVVHHVVLSFRKHTPETIYGVQPAPAKPRDENGDIVRAELAKSEAARAGGRQTGGGGPAQPFEAVWVPGNPPSDFRLWNAAKLIPAGYDLEINMHYTPNGKDTSDQTQVGFTIAKGEPTHRFITSGIAPPIDPVSFHIPAGDPNWEDKSEVTLAQDADLVWFMPHMHLRGKDMTYTITYPTGETETALSVKWNFDWQLAFDVQKPLHLPKGTKIQAVGHYDNSPANKWNPNPNKDVWWGDQTWEEMFVAWYGLVVDKDVDPKQVLQRAAR